MPQVVPDRLKYSIKAPAVTSINKLGTFPADGTDTYDGNTSNVLRFTIPHSASDDFVDPTMSRIRIRMQLLIRDSDADNWTLSDGERYDLEAICLDRGIESIIRRLEIKDVSGNLLESIDHYNCLYAVTELCTGVPEVRRTRGRFTFECLTKEDYEWGTELWPPTLYQTIEGLTLQARTYELSFNLFSGVFGGTCEKYWPLKPINGLVIELQLENPVDCLRYKYGFNTQTTRNNFPRTNNIDNIPSEVLGRPVNPAHTPAQRLDDAVAGWDAVITVNNYPVAGRQVWSPITYNPELTAAAAEKISYKIYKPVIQLNRITVHNGVGSEIIEAGKRMSPDGRLRIQTHSWKVLSTQILASATNFNYIIPIKVS